MKDSSSSSFNSSGSVTSFSSSTSTSSTSFSSTTSATTTNSNSSISCSFDQPMKFTSFAISKKSKSKSSKGVNLRDDHQNEKDKDNSKNSKKELFTSVEGKEFITDTDKSQKKGPLVIPFELQSQIPVLPAHIIEKSKSNSGFRDDISALTLASKDVDEDTDISMSENQDQIVSSQDQPQPDSHPHEHKPPNDMENKTKEFDESLTHLRGTIGETNNLDKLSSYGLIHLDKSHSSSTSISSAISTSSSSSAYHQLMQNRIVGIESIDDEDERFRLDVKARPDSAALEAYEDIPIEGFGEALLRGMGWEPGAPVGLTRAGVAIPYEVKLRPGNRLGLGANPETVQKQKELAKLEKKGVSVEAESIKKKNNAAFHFGEGMLVNVIDGPLEGSFGVVVETRDNTVFLKLTSCDKDKTKSPNEAWLAQHDVSVVDVSKLSIDHPALKFFQEYHQSSIDSLQTMIDQHSKERSSDSKKIDSTGSSKGNTTTATHIDRDQKKHKSCGFEDSSHKKEWLLPNLVVRIVSKKFQGGKFYKKKATVVDVVSPTECILMLDNQKLVEGVPTRVLETVIPRSGGKAKVVRGSDKGNVGTLLERKGSSRVVLQCELAIKTYYVDDVCHFVGQLDET